MEAVFFDYVGDENSMAEDIGQHKGFKESEYHLNGTALGDLVTQLTVMRYR